MGMATDVAIEYGRVMLRHQERDEPTPHMELVCDPHTFNCIRAGEDAKHLVGLRTDGVWEVANLPVRIDPRLDDWSIQQRQM